MTWEEQQWECEDCAVIGKDWGVPDRCPNCNGPNVTVVERCAFCGEVPDGGVFNDGLRCKMCAEEQDGEG